MLSVDMRDHCVQEWQALLLLYLDVKLGGGIDTVDELEVGVGVLQGSEKTERIIGVSSVKDWEWYSIFNQQVLVLQVRHPDVSQYWT